MFDKENSGNSKMEDLKSRTIHLKIDTKPALERLRKGFNVSSEVSNNVGDVSSKKQKFEAFLSYRKYLSRLALSQALQFHETFKILNPEDLSFEEEVNEIYRVIIYFYKKIFLLNKYGDNKKNKKLEERFVRLNIINFLKNKELVDSYIKNNINKKWCLSKLNSVIRSSLRAAICEAVYSKKVSHKIIVNEYTDIVANSVATKKEVDFFNAVLDSIIKQINIDYA